ncbi:barrier-to-autointegration factor-like [Salarias fasciatus]|uniref:Barrier-to-autointegration factor-like protein n=1 Tax=Salarias fasciatus TaxID=181472 RepID=A0A672IBG2_SALFA|nr:barrier-to-autointegration factor-like [Salarias fasciatus]XP_029956767.1 barrier-to-autointegration factor-like [Salarias fasciatus]
MSSTSQKHRAFVAEPMGQKRAEALPGIGEVLGGRLRERGFGKANNVLGQYLVLNQDQHLFQRWLKDTCGANAKQQHDCYAGVQEWCSGNV